VFEEHRSPAVVPQSCHTHTHSHTHICACNAYR